VSENLIKDMKCTYMKTPYLDEMINELDGYIGSSDNYLSKKGNEKLAELKAIKKQLLLHLTVMPRFFVDLRSGCGAVRDRLHPDFDADYQGLHNDTIDVVEYRHGFQNSETKSWDMKQEDINFLNERCTSLNGA